MDLEFPEMMQARGIAPDAEISKQMRDYLAQMLTAGRAVVPGVDAGMRTAEGMKSGGGLNGPEIAGILMALAGGGALAKGAQVSGRAGQMASRALELMQARQAPGYGMADKAMAMGDNARNWNLAGGAGVGGGLMTALGLGPIERQRAQERARRVPEATAR